MNLKKVVKIIVLFLFATASLFARENVKRDNVTTSAFYKNLAVGCAPATAQTDLELNNVRAKILNGGDMWWDQGLAVARYEVPKGSGKHSLFAGSLWIGGVDAGGQLKVAAMTYRQNGNDFFPGPLSTASASTSSDQCIKYDQIWKISRSEVEEFVNNGFTSPSPAISSWPGNGRTGFSPYLAPFYDSDQNGIYEPAKGDYPYYRLKNDPLPDINGCTTCGNFLFGDQTLWWVFNDRGNIHSESGAQAIGLEVQAQAFAFATNDEINNMTFYQYKIINRSSYQVNDTYFGQWVDPDLGNYLDDYVGCDVGRGLGYCYNGDPDDEGAQGYGLNPPAIGVDFFQGPIADSNDKIDNNRDGIIDEPCEQIIMSKFVYFNNDNTVQGNPYTGAHFYNYLRGLWLDGTPMTYGGSGYNSGQKCNFMFPDNTDPDFSTPWTETTAGNTPGDRRFLQSAGKFTLAPGAVNFVTVGVLWARAEQGGSSESVKLLKRADDKAQALFNNCFKVLDGPDAPDLSIRELNQQLVITIADNPNSNNYREQYEEIDPTIISGDNKYRFQGYQIFQLKDKTVSISEIHNPDKARLVAQCDIEDNIGTLVNYNYDPSLQANVPVKEVTANNKGIQHTFLVKSDLFANGSDNGLINHKTYYFTAISYSYNQYKKYDPNDPASLDGQKKPYFAGRRNIKTYTGIPHIPDPGNFGQDVQSSYGKGPRLQRLDGGGNGGMILDLSEQTVNDILTSASYEVLNPVYTNSKGPARIKVYDPIKVPKAEFRLYIDSIGGKVSGISKWRLVNTSNNNETVFSNTTISVNNEQIIPKWGLSVNIVQVKSPGDSAAVNNGFLEATKVYKDPSHPWLSGLEDKEGETYENWIRSGKYSKFIEDGEGDYNDYDLKMDQLKNVNGRPLDPNQDYEKILGGTWAPYRLCSKERNGPAASSDGAILSLTKLANLSSVDVVITPDQSKWSRCAVVEMSDDSTLSEGRAKKFSLRKHASVGKNGKPDNNPDMPTGMGWFPGYAINVETGERLNIMFGEDSWLISENGRDMIWNPTSNKVDNFDNPLFGGKHYIYILGHSSSMGVQKYDEGKSVYNLLITNSPSKKRLVYADAMWVSIPLLEKNEKLLSSEVKIRLRIARPYETKVPGGVNGGNPCFAFNTADLYNDKNNLDKARQALDLINVVPNPYYAYSEYEQNQLDSKVKITNLPPKCTVSIYTISGTLIRRFKSDLSGNPDTSEGGTNGNNSESAVEWDLKNTKGIPVSSGIYLIHIEAEGVGEKILKWMGIMRPLDLDTF